MTGIPDWNAWLRFTEAASRYLFLNWAAQSTLILAAGLAASSLPRLRAAVRHAILVGTLLLAAFAPLALLAAAPAKPRHPLAATSRRPNHARPAHLPAAAGEAGEASAELPYLGFVLLGVWTLLVGDRVLRLGVGLWIIKRWTVRAQPVTRGRLYDACGYHVADIPVLEAAGVTVPMVLGISRPRIVLPLGMAAALSDEELGMVLLHEEAHVRRRDPLWFLAAELAHAVLYWHPLAEWTRRRLTQAAEDACDARVLSACGSGPGYARILLTVLERSSGARSWVLACPLGSAGAELRRRVARILAAPRPTSRVMAAVSGSAMLTAGAVAAHIEVGDRPLVPRRPALPLLPRVAAAPRRSEPPVVVVRRTVGPAFTRPARTRESQEPAGMLPGLLPGAPSPAELALERDRSPREGRTFVFLLDNSSGMRGHQEEARAGILDQIQQLSPADRFNVVALAEDAVQFAELPVTLSEDSLAGVRAWIGSLPEAGTAELRAGLSRALSVPELTSLYVYSNESAWRGLGQPDGLGGLVALENRGGAQVLTVAFSDPAGNGIDPLPGSPIPGRPPAAIQTEQNGHVDLRP